MANGKDDSNLENAGRRAAMGAGLTAAVAMLATLATRSAAAAAETLTTHKRPETLRMRRTQTPQTHKLRLAGVPQTHTTNAKIRRPQTHTAPARG